jgi:hypothetical protein
MEGAIAAVYGGFGFLLALIIPVLRLLGTVAALGGENRRAG